MKATLRVWFIAVRFRRKTAFAVSVELLRPRTAAHSKTTHSNTSSRPAPAHSALLHEPLPLMPAGTSSGEEGTKYCEICDRLIVVRWPRFLR
jgi:hypothetical protein